MLELGFDLLPSMLSNIHLSRADHFHNFKCQIFTKLNAAKVVEGCKFGNFPKDCVQMEEWRKIFRGKALRSPLFS